MGCRALLALRRDPTIRDTAILTNWRFRNMLSPVTSVGNVSQGSFKQWLCVTIALLLSVACAQIAGFDDFKGASSGGKFSGTSASTGGAGFIIEGGGTSLGGSTARGTTDVIFAGSTSLGGSSSLGGSNGTGGSSAPCGALTQGCCTGDTCTATNTVCNTTSHMCEACGSTNGRCCQAETRCNNNGCCVSDR